MLERSPLRHTPAGIPVIEFQLGHRSRQEEAGGIRQVECEIGCIALGTSADLLDAAALGSGLTVTGFLAARSLKRRTPVLHVTKIEFHEGNQDGFQTQDDRQEKG